MTENRVPTPIPATIHASQFCPDRHPGMEHDEWAAMTENRVPTTEPRTEAACPKCGHDVDHTTACPDGCPLCLTSPRARLADKLRKMYGPSLRPDDPDHDGSLTDWLRDASALAEAERPAPPLEGMHGGDHECRRCGLSFPLEQPAPHIDVEALIADVLALEPPPVRRDTLRGWHDALAEASHLLRARLGSVPSPAPSVPSVGMLAEALHSSYSIGCRSHALEECPYPRSKRTPVDFEAWAMRVNAWLAYNQPRK